MLAHALEPMRLSSRRTCCGEVVGVVRAVERVLESPLEGTLAWEGNRLPGTIDIGVMTVRCGDPDAERTCADEGECRKARGGDRGGAATDCTLQCVAAGSTGPERRLARGRVVAAGTTVELPRLKFVRQDNAGLPAALSGCEVCIVGCAAAVATAAAECGT